MEKTLQCHFTSFLYNLTLSLFLVLGVSYGTVAQTSLNPGDIVLVTVNADDDKNFDFAPLVELQSGTEIHFTDDAYIAEDDEFRDGEGTITYTAPETISAGTVVNFDGTTGDDFSESGNFNPALSGDNILVYQGDTDDPEFVYGVGWARGESVWEYDTSGETNRSDIPPELDKDDKTILSLGSDANYQYDSSNGIEGTASRIIDWVGEETNWSADDEAFSSFSEEFSLRDPPTVAFVEEESAISENENTAEIAVKLSESNTTEVTVEVALLTSAGKAENGVDFETYDTETVTFSADASSGDTQTVALNLKDNNEFEGSRQVVFELRNISTGTIIEPAEHTLTINDDDAPDIIINEIHAAPDSELGDADNNGEAEGRDDEFVEFVNNEDAPIDISSWSFSDETNQRHVFPEGTVIPAGGALVLFGDADISPSGNFGGAIVQSSNDGASLGLNNTGDTVFLRDSDGSVVAEHSYGSEANDGQSITRNPDLEGALDTKHADISDADDALFSPGTKVNGEAFGAKYATGIRGKEGWRMISSPTQQTTFEDLLGQFWMQGVNGSSDPSGPETLLYWSEKDQAFQKPSDMDDSMEAGRGYIVYFFEDDEYNTPGIQGGFPKTVVTDNDQNESQLTQAVSATDQNGSGDIDEEEGWNLLGNPFGTDISVTALLDALEDADPSVNSNIHVWDHQLGDGQGGYRTVSDGDKIAPFQAFFVRYEAEGVDEEVAFNRDDLAANVGTGLRKQNEEVDFNIALELHGDTFYDTYFVEFGRNRERELDRYDAHKLFSLNTESINLFSLEEGRRLMKNALPADLNEPLEIPLGFNAPPQSGFTFQWDELENVPSGWQLTLIDRENNREIDMARDNEYRFTTSSQNKENSTEDLLNKQSQENEEVRFVIAVTPAGSEVDNNDQAPESVKLNPNYPNPFSSTTTISYSLNEEMQTKVTVWNIVGQRVATLVDGVVEAGDHEETWNASDMPSGIYITQLEVGGEVYIRKMTLIK